MRAGAHRALIVPQLGVARLRASYGERPRARAPNIAVTAGGHPNLWTEAVPAAQLPLLTPKKSGCHRGGLRRRLPLGRLAGLRRHGGRSRAARGGEK